MNSKFRALLIFLIISLCVSKVYSEDNKNTPFTLSKGRELALFTAAGVLNGGAYLTGKLLDKETAWEKGAESFNKDDIFFADRWALNSYSESEELAGEIAHYSLIASPALLLYGKDLDDIKTISVMYLETILLTEGFKEIIKKSVTRYRPYSYYSLSDEDMLKDSDSADSFFSGHTARSFASASFFTYVYSKYSTPGRVSIPAAAVSYSLASFSGIMRVVSGMHFPSDVLTGAISGTFIGLLVPYLHDKGADGNFPFVLKTMYEGNAAVGFDLSLR